MGEIFVAKSSEHLCRIPPYMAYSLGFALHVAGWKLILSN